MSKAEKIFRDTRWSCLQHVKRWGYDGIGFANVVTDDVVYTRTLNDMHKVLVTEGKRLATNFKLGIIDEAEYKFQYQVLYMVHRTIENARGLLR